MSLYVIGSFAITAGHRVETPNPKSKARSFHDHYSTVIQCSNGNDMPANVRVYSPSINSLLPDGKVVFMCAKAAFPAPNSPQVVIMDAFEFFPYPGNPLSPDYQDLLPDHRYPYVSVVGRALDKPATEPDGISRGFDMSVAEYVRDSLKMSTLHCVFDGNSARWRNCPSPEPNSLIHVFGTFAAVRNGSLSIKMANIVLNFGPVGPVASLSPATDTKRKFATVASSSGTTVIEPSQSTSPDNTPAALTSPLTPTPAPAKKRKFTSTSSSSKKLTASSSKRPTASSSKRPSASSSKKPAANASPSNSVEFTPTLSVENELVEELLIDNHTDSSTGSPGALPTSPLNVNGSTELTNSSRTLRGKGKAPMRFR